MYFLFGDNKINRFFIQSIIQIGQASELYFQRVHTGEYRDKKKAAWIRLLADTYAVFLWWRCPLPLACEALLLIYYSCANNVDI